MTTDSMLPILRELIDADGDAVRAGVLLRLPDTILLKYRPVIEEACLRARFDAGLAFLDVRLAALRAVRGADGRLPPDYAADLERMLDAFAGAAKAARLSATPRSGGEGDHAEHGGGGASAAEEPPAPSRPAAEPPLPPEGVEDGRQVDRLPGDGVAP